MTYMEAGLGMIGICILMAVINFILYPIENPNKKKVKRKKKVGGKKNGKSRKVL